MENTRFKGIRRVGNDKGLSKKGKLHSGKHISIFTTFVGLKSVFSRIYLKSTKNVELGMTKVYQRRESCIQGSTFRYLQLL